MHLAKFFQSALLALLLGASLSAQRQPPASETLTYRVEWRLVTAGRAVLRLNRESTDRIQTQLEISSVGLVNRLYRVQDVYKLTTTDKFCGVALNFDSQEGKKHLLTNLAFDNERRKLINDTKDLVANKATHAELDIPACAYDIMGALMNLRTTAVEPGTKTSIPVTDGKKLVNVRIDALNKEKIVVDNKPYNAVRYEAYVFDNVLYRRKGRLFVWLTDDANRYPVQMRFQFSFPLGEVNLILEKVE